MVFDVQQRALGTLKGNWFKVVGLVFICYLIAVVTGTSRSGLSFDDGFSFSLLSFGTTDSLLLIILGGFTGSICFFAVVDLIHHIKYLKGKKFFSTFLYSFKNSSLLIKGFVINAINRLLQFMAVMLTIISLLNYLTLLTGEYTSSDIARVVGISSIPILMLWVYLGLSQAMYILYDQPKINLFKCIYHSFKLMRGNRWSLIALYVIFIIWFSLGLLALIVGVLWSLAYFEVARFEFYQMLKRNSEAGVWNNYT